MSKKMCLFSILLTFCMLLCACKGVGKMEEPSVCQYLEGFQINNDPIKNNSVAYMINELESFFEQYYLFEEGNSVAKQCLLLDDIDQQFPVEYLRKSSTKPDSYYIAYRVVEGGTYIVFLGAMYGTENSDSIGRDGKRCFLGALYIHDLPSLTDLHDVGIGDSYDTLKEKAPCTQIVTMRSSNVVSYSLLSNGDVLKCTYSKTEQAIFIIDNMSTVKKTDPQFPYKGMVETDLLGEHRADGT